ncbi:hypothetical protein IP69_10205 [Bosea sp. AAP35]|uniref:ferric reductase-like transmembrane domain-containing protein n=1 Tax=Bosea sp. AAP35 TaxID=1523417 RepID=UPI0006B9657E|nr:ferric reductase-like transmembrane domain-containing protein [Bosea sp. AAP35]KPF69713.1 hypothetical protein IP69_10205 [Bosea sp. AAP35]
MKRAGVDGRLRVTIWLLIALVAVVPIAAAAASPLLRGREWLWIAGGMAGVVALSLLFVQPLLMAAAPPLTAVRDRIAWHRWGAIAIVALVALHIGALYAYSPDDVTDILLLAAPTSFSVYGVIGMWCLILTVALTSTRRLLRLGYKPWRIVHSVLAVALAGSSVVHAIQIEGAMEDYSKLAICLATLAATTAAVLEINLFVPMRQRKLRNAKAERGTRPATSAM